MIAFLPYLVPAILGFVCLVLWAVAAGLVLLVKRQDRGTVPITGEVTGFGSYTSRGGQTMYYAQYAATIDGQPHTGRSAVSKSWQSPAVGTRVALRFKPSEPERPLIEISWLRYLAPLILGITGGGLLMGGAIAGFAVSHQIAKFQASKPSTSSSHGEVTPIPLVALSNATISGWQPVYPPSDHKSSWLEFDAIADLAWAQTIANAWAPDAILVKLELTGCTATGKIDLQDDPDAEVVYAYYSPARADQVVDATRVRPPRVNVGLRVSVKGKGNVTVFEDYKLPAGGKLPHTLGAPACGLDAAVATLKASAGLPDRKIYKASLSYAGEQPVWQLDGIAPFPTRIPPVSASTCRPI